jgi:hypothetical protein
VYENHHQLEYEVLKNKRSVYVKCFTYSYNLGPNMQTLVVVVAAAAVVLKYLLKL